MRGVNNCLHRITKQTPGTLSQLPFLTSSSKVCTWVHARVSCMSSLLRGLHKAKARSNLTTRATVRNQKCRIPKWLKCAASLWKLKTPSFSAPYIQLLRIPYTQHCLDMESPSTGAHILTLPLWTMLLSQQAVHFLPKGHLWDLYLTKWTTDTLEVTSNGSLFNGKTFKERKWWSKNYLNCT